MTPNRLAVPSNLDHLDILAFSDCRVQHIPGLLEWIDAQQTRPDLILYGGDDCGRFRPDDATNHFETLASKATYGLAAVIGNDDVVESRALISGERVFELHSRPLQIGPFLIGGIEGSPLDEEDLAIGATLHSEEEIARHLRAVTSLDNSLHLLVLSHTPPRGSLDSAIRFGRREIGSVSLAKALRSQAAPEIVVCGHVHSKGGLSELSGQTRVINVASHDSYGAPLVVAQFTWSAREPANSPLFSIDWNRLPSLVGLQTIWGIGPHYTVRLEREGISTVEGLAASTPEAVGRALGWAPSSASLRPLILRAQAALQDTLIFIQQIAFPPPPRLFVDIETDPDSSRYVWLVGAFDEANGEFRQFFASKPSLEPQMVLSPFAEYCKRTSCTSLVCYSGTNFDTRMLVERMKAKKFHRPNVVVEGTDLFYDLRSSVALPIPSYALKEVAFWLGYRFHHPELDGWQAAYEYESATARNPPVPPKLARKLREYNADDVMSMAHTVHSLEARWYYRAI